MKSIDVSCKTPIIIDKEDYVIELYEGDDTTYWYANIRDRMNMWGYDIFADSYEELISKMDFKGVAL